MKEQLISFNTAKLAKEKGFKLTYEVVEEDGLPRNSFHYYMPQGDLKYSERDEYGNHGDTPFHHSQNTFYRDDGCCIAPPQSLLQKWLRDIHNIHAFAWCNASGWGWEIEKTNGTHIAIMDIDGDIEGVDPSSGMFDSFEKALEAGLYEALKLI